MFKQTKLTKYLCFFFSQLALEAGVFLATFGSKDILSSRVHIDNLTNAHILAADSLCEHKNHISVSIKDLDSILYTE